MACYHLLDAWRFGPDGKPRFKNPHSALAQKIRLPCGRCIGCKLERSRQNAVRCMHEASLHTYSSFVTLTFNNNYASLGFSLDYTVFQSFMKAVRYRYGPTRFFMCGEYGEVNRRAHFHALLFGLSFDDRVFYKNLPSGFKLYTSKNLSALWPYGFSTVGDVTFESAAYTARYCCQKISGDMAQFHYCRLDSDGNLRQIEPEFGHMSLKPGIGERWFRKYRSDVYPRDNVVVRGKECRPPKYYDTLESRLPDSTIEGVKFQRELDAVEREWDSTPERLAVRETVARSRLKFKRRSLE